MAKATVIYAFKDDIAFANKPFECSSCKNVATYRYWSIIGGWAFGCNQHYRANRRHNELGKGMAQKIVVRPVVLKKESSI